MPSFVAVCRLGFAALLLIGALVALPCSMAWSGESGLQQQALSAQLDD